MTDPVGNLEDSFLVTRLILSITIHIEQHLRIRKCSLFSVGFLDLCKVLADGCGVVLAPVRQHREMSRRMGDIPIFELDKIGKLLILESCCNIECIRFANTLSILPHFINIFHTLVSNENIALPI